MLGWSLPTVRLVRTTLAPGDCLVMATDGIAADFGSSLQPGVPAEEQAGACSRRMRGGRMMRWWWRCAICRERPW